DGYLAEVKGRFQTTTAQMHGRRLQPDPLTIVTKRFLAAAGPDPSAEPLVRPVRLTADSEARNTRNLIHLASWERREPPPGPRILPLDGLTQPDYEPVAGPVP